MSNQHFPDPFQSGGDQDEFSGPALQNEVGGASNLDPASFSDRGNKKGLLFIAVAVAALVVIIILARTWGGDEQAAVVQDPNVATAPPSSAVEVNPLEQIAQMEQNSNSQTTQGKGELIEEREIQNQIARSEEAAGSGGALWDVPPTAPALGSSGGTAEALPQAGSELGVPGLIEDPSQVATNQAAGQPSGQGATDPVYDAAVAAEDARAQRELQKQMEKEAREKAKADERKRLREKGTKLAESEVSGQDQQVRSALTDALGSSEADQMAALMNMAQQNAAALDPSTQAPGSAVPALPGASGGTDRDNVYGILPGTRINAVTTSEFISDAEGAGIVEVRLGQALRAGGRVVLPAGTRAYGTASGSYSVGRQARVSITFNTFVTPDGRVIKNLVGKAADPQTMAMSVPAKVDHRYASRIARGAVATALDIALTKDMEPRSIYQTPSPREQAIMDARDRLHNILGTSVGDEASTSEAVILEMETPITIVFGL